MGRPEEKNEAGDSKNSHSHASVDIDGPKQDDDTGNVEVATGRDYEDMPKLGEGDYIPSPRPILQDQLRQGDGDFVTGAQGIEVAQALSSRDDFDEGGEFSGDEQDDLEPAGTSRSRRRITSNDEPKPNLIVNYLPQSLSDRDFFNFFAPFGLLESIKIMRDSQTGYSFGYGFVNYIELDDAVDARNAMNGMEIGHKRIKVSFARPPSDEIKDTNLFVTGLPTSINEDQLEDMFARFGVIVHLRVLRDRHTNVARGVAFVRYETRQEACSAIVAMNGVIPNGGRDPIRVRLAQDHGKQKAAYLAGYQAALKMKGGIPLTDNIPHPLLRPENAYGQLGQLRNSLASRGRPSIASAHRNRVGQSSSDQSLYWKGFLQGATEPVRQSILGRRKEDRRGGSANGTGSRSRC